MILRLLLCISFCFSASHTFACSVFSYENKVAKTLDWYQGTGMVLVNKRNVEKIGNLVSPYKNLVWKSQFMSVTITQSGQDYPWEGMNEAGLTVNSLQLLNSQSPPPDQRATIDYVQWIQYILDTAQDLPSAIQQARKVRVHDFTNLHYFVCDAKNKCASFENINGELIITPSVALTNDPYQASRAYLKKKQLTPQVKLDNSPESLERFYRATYWSQNYQQTQDSLAYGFAALENLSQVNDHWRTYWKIIFDRKQKIFYIKTRLQPETKIIELIQFNPSCLEPTQYLLSDATESGFVNLYFQDLTTDKNQWLIEQNPLISKEIRPFLIQTLENNTACLEK